MKIVKNYINAYNSYKSGQYNNTEVVWGAINKNLGNVIHGGSNYNRFMHSNLVYKIVDYNKDGIPELFIGSRTTNKYFGLYGYSIFDVYTYDTDRDCAVKLTRNNSGHRSSYEDLVVCRNGILATPRSGNGFECKNIFYKIQSNKNKFLEIACIEARGKGPFKKIRYFKRINGKLIKTSKSGFNKSTKKYYKPITMVWYKADNKAANGMVKGIFTYKGQKNWKLKPISDVIILR